MITNPSPDIPVLYPALSSEIVPSSSKNRVTKIIITTLILFGVFNALICWAVFQYDRQHLMRKFTLIDLLDEPVDVLILGDSGVSTGIMPQVIEDVTGLRALNVSLNAGWTYYNDVWTLEHYIEKFGAPSFIIWGHAYDNNHFTFDHVTQLSGVSHFYGREWYSQYVTPIMTIQDTLTILVHRLFPIYFRDQTIDDILTNLSQNGSIAIDDFTLIATQGFDAKTEINIRRVEVHAKTQTIRDEYRFSEDNQRVIEIFLDMIEQYQIPTYAMITPVNPIIGEKQSFQSATRSVRLFWDALSQEHALLHFNPEIPLYPSEDMYDSDHLNVYGAEHYTQYLIDWIWGEYELATLDQIYAGE